MYDNPPDVEIVTEGKITRRRYALVSTQLKSSDYYSEADIKYFNMPDFMQLLKLTQNKFHKYQYLLLFETGARIGEMQMATYGDVDHVRKRIKLITLKQRCEKPVYRILTISSQLSNIMLQRQLYEGFQKNDYLLAKKPTLNSISRQSARQGLQRWTRIALGEYYLDKAHPHVFRHTRAIQLLDSGMNIMKLKMFLGHASISSTLIYVKFSGNDLAESITKSNESIGLI